MSNNMGSVEDRIKKVISQQLDVPVETIRPEHHFVIDLRADSLAVIELIMGFEEEFDLDIADSDVESVKTVQQAVDYVTNRIADR